MFSLIRNVSIQNDQAAAFIFQLMNRCPWETVQCFVAENLWLQWGVTWTSNLMTNSLPIEIWTIKTRCYIRHVFNTDYGEKRYSRYLFVVLIFKMIPVHWQRHFILTDVEWMILRIFFCDKIFLWQKCLTSRRVSPQNLSIHVECSAILSGFWPILVPDRIKSVQNTLSQRTGFVILWSAACNPILHK